MGVDTLAQLLALASFLVGFAGIAMIVVSASRGEAVKSGVGMAFLGIVVGIVFMIIAEGLLVVGPTERAVVFNTISGDLEEPRQSGISVVIPGIQQVIMYDVSQQNYTMSDSQNEGNIVGADAIRARSVDGQEVRVDITVIYNVSTEDVNTLHRNWPQRNYADDFIRPTVRSVVRDVVALLEAEQIYGGSRDLMQSEILADLIVEFDKQGLILTSALVRDINFSDAFINAIEAKQVEEQALARAETAAQRARTEARGEADAAIESARGESEAIRIRAAANAEALRLVSEQIAANPNLIQYLYVTTLSDNVDIVLVPSTSPFLFDASSFTNLGNDFVAPDVPASLLPDNSSSNEESDSGD